MVHVLSFMSACFKVYVTGNHKIHRMSQELTCITEIAEMTGNDGRSQDCVYFLHIHSLMYLMAIYGNDGLTLIPAQSRSNRFHDYLNNEITLEGVCNKPRCNLIKIGNSFSCEQGSGKIIALAYKRNKRGLSYPAHVLCSCYGKIRTAFVLVKDVRPLNTGALVVKIKI